MSWGGSKGREKNVWMFQNCQVPIKMTAEKQPFLFVSIFLFYSNYCWDFGLERSRLWSTENKVADDNKKRNKGNMNLK